MLHRVLTIIGAIIMSTLLFGASDGLAKSERKQPLERPAAASAVNQDARTCVVLPNGLKVLVEEDDRFPLVSLRLYVHAGSAYETDDQAGISHLLEHMVFKSTLKRPEGQAAKDIEAAGGEINASTSFDYTVYLADLPSDKWKLGLDVFKDMIFGAKFDPKELESERQVVLSELERGEDDPGNRLFKSLQPMVFDGTTYARPVIGYRKSVEKVTSQDLKQYVKKYYQPGSMLLVVCGRVKASDVLQAAKEYFGELKNDRATSDPDSFPEIKVNGPKVKLSYGNWNKVYLQAAFPLPGLRAAKDPGLDVLGRLLGGDATSRFSRKFKYEQKLVDDVSVDSMTLERAGLMQIEARLDADKLEAFWNAMLSELSGLNADSFTDEEISRAKLNVENSLFQAKETLAGLTMKIGYFEFFGLGSQAEENYLYQLANVDRAQLNGLIANYLRPEKLCASLLAPQAEGLPAPDDAAAKLTAQVAGLWKAKPLKAQDQASGQGQGKPEVLEVAPGRTLVLLPDSTMPYTALSMVINGGDALLDNKTQGLAELCAKALTRGTQNRSVSQIEDFLSDRVSTFSAISGRDSFVLDAKFPTRFSADILGLISETFREPAFRSEEVERAAQIQASGIKAQEDQPLGLAFRNVFPFLFPDSHYGFFRLGQIGDLAGFTPEVLKQYWERQRERPFVISVCGQFDREAIIKMVKDMAEFAPKAQDFAYGTPVYTQKKELSLTLAERNQAHLLLIYPVSGLRSEDAAGLSLLKTMLSGQGGLLFRDLRDRQGLGYSVTALLWQAPNTGFLAFYIGTTPDKLGQARKGFASVSARLAKSVLPAEELKRAQSLMVGDYYRDHQSLKSRSQEAASLLSAGFPLDHEQILLDKAKNVTPEALRNLAAKYLVESKAYVLEIKP